MITRTEFDIDCNPVIPECGYDCAKCIQEIESTLTSINGVQKVYLEGGEEEGKVVAEHDSTVATVDQLLDTLGTLPSFYEGFFVPTVISS